MKAPFNNLGVIAVMFLPLVNIALCSIMLAATFWIIPIYSVLVGDEDDGIRPNSLLLMPVNFLLMLSGPFYGLATMSRDCIGKMMKELRILSRDLQ